MATRQPADGAARLIPKHPAGSAIAPDSASGFGIASGPGMPPPSSAPPRAAQIPRTPDLGPKPGLWPAAMSSHCPRATATGRILAHHASAHGDAGLRCALLVPQPHGRSPRLCRSSPQEPSTPVSPNPGIARSVLAKPASQPNGKYRTSRSHQRFAEGATQTACLAASLRYLV